MLVRQGCGSPWAGSQGSLQGEVAVPSTSSLFISLWMGSRMLARPHKALTFSGAMLGHFQLYR